MAKRNNIIYFAVKRRRKDLKKEFNRKNQDQTKDRENVKQYRCAAIILTVLAIVLVGIEVIIALSVRGCFQSFLSRSRSLRTV